MKNSLCKQEVCYGKEYSSRKALAQDFGFEGSRYNQFCALRNAGMDTENAVEITVDGNHNKALGLLKKGVSIEIVVNRFNPKKDSKLESVSSTVDSTIYEPVLEEKETVQESFDTANPIFFEIKSPSQLITELGKMKVDTINFIDFENTCGSSGMDIKEYIEADNTINVFFYNACLYSNSFFKVIKNSKNINLQVLIYKSTSQLVDHLISFYLGALYTAYPDKQYNIISRDSGFFSVIDVLRHENIKIIGRKRLDSKDDRFKYSLFRYLCGTKLNHRNCIMHNEFVKIMEGFYKDRKEVTDAEMARISDKLEGYGVLEFVHKSGIDYYKFDMVKIKEFVETK